MKQTINKMACTLALGATLLFSCAAHAVDLKIAVLDMRYIMANSNESKAVQAKLKKEFAPRDQELISREKALKELAEKLQRNGAIMSPAERAKLETDGNNKQKELQRLQLKLQQDVNTRQRDEMQKLLDKLQKAIAQVVAKKKLDMVLLSDAVPYAGHQPEITQDVMQTLAGK